MSTAGETGRNRGETIEQSMRKRLDEMKQAGERLRGGASVRLASAAAPA
jgi:hypothetical protein